MGFLASDTKIISHSRNGNNRTADKTSLTAIASGYFRFLPPVFIIVSAPSRVIPPGWHIQMGSRPIPDTTKKGTQMGTLLCGAGNRTRTCTLSQWNLNPPSLPIPPCPHIHLCLFFTRGGTRGGPLRWVHRYQNRQACFSLTHTSIGIASYPRGYRGQPSHSPLPAVPFVPASPEPDDRND